MSQRVIWVTMLVTGACALVAFGVGFVHGEEVGMNSIARSLTKYKKPTQSYAKYDWGDQKPVIWEDKEDPPSNWTCWWEPKGCFSSSRHCYTKPPKVIQMREE